MIPLCCPWTYLKLLNVLISPASILCPSICSSSQVPVQFIVRILSFREGFKIYIHYISYIISYTYILYILACQPVRGVVVLRAGGAAHVDHLLHPRRHVLLHLEGQSECLSEMSNYFIYYAYLLDMYF